MKTSLPALVATFIFGASVLFAAGEPVSCPKTDAAKCEKTAPCCAGKKDQPCKKCAEKKCETACETKAQTCPVSGEKLGSMGKAYEYVYKQAGKPDLTVLLCCKACVKAFEKDPAKYLAQSGVCKK